MTELLSAPAFMLWGSPVSWLELVASTLALAMVGCNMREIHWGWPLAIVSSVLYVAVFAKARIYGDASLQVFFALVALWGWAQWLRGHRAGRTTVVVSSSPLVLDAVDEVAFLRDGRVVATGTHASLLESRPDYRAVVTRESSPEEPTGEAAGEAADRGEPAEVGS